MASAPRALKAHLDHDGQLALLEHRGLQIGDRPAATKALERLGYYRLSGYFYPLRKTKPVGESGRLDGFVDGASFQLVTDLAEFDKSLRLLVLNAIETIEVAARVGIAYRLGKLAPDAHLIPDLHDRSFTAPAKGPGSPSRYEAWLERYVKQCDQSKEEFTKHHRESYGGKMPIWVAIELWDFGLLSVFFSGMHKRAQSQVAHSLGGVDGSILASWLHSFTFLRNVAAHHSRLWNRTTPLMPKLPPKDRFPLLAHLHQPNSEPVLKLYGTLACLRFLLRTIHPQSDWHTQLKCLAKSFPQTPLVALSDAGFPSDWDAMPLWA